MTPRSNKKNTTIWEFAVLAVFFCFAVSLFNRAGYIFAAIAVFTVFFFFKNIKISIFEVVLLLYSVSYFIAYCSFDKISAKSIVIYLVGPWVAYIIGKIYVKKGDKKAFLKLVIILAAGLFAHGMLNIVAYLRSDYFAMYAYQRNSVDFWQNSLSTVTVTGMYYTFATGISLGVLFSDAKRKYKIIAAVVLLLAVAATVFFANRTLIAIIIALFVVWLLTYFFSGKISSRTKIKVVLLLMLFATVVLLLFLTNFAGFKDWFLSLKIVNRIGEVGRIDVWSRFFKDNNWMKFPFGGKEITKNYMHNLWLDVYNVAGVFPFVFLLIFTILAVADFFKFRKVMLKSGKNVEYTIFKYLMLAVLLNCMVEPIIEANPYYFLIVIMFIGAMRAQIEKSEVVLGEP